MMIELAFTVCLLATPDACEERSLLFYDVRPEQCVAGAPPELAKWSMQHEGWRVTRWTCGLFDPSSRDA